MHETLLKEAAVLRLLELTKNEDLIWEAFTDGATYTDNRYLRNPLRYGCTPAYIRYVQSSRGGLDDMRSYIYQNRRALDSVEYVCPDKALRESVRKMLEKNLRDVYITSSSDADASGASMPSSSTFTRAVTSTGRWSEAAGSATTLLPVRITDRPIVAI